MAAAAKPFRLPGPLAHHAAMPPEELLGDKESRDSRITSVMPRTVKLVNEFINSLRAAEKHLFPFEDVLQECWLVLCEKDHYFDYRAKYITFANLIVMQKLKELRNRWHIVPGPKDTASKLRAGEQCATIEAIRRTIRETSSLDEMLLPPEEDPDGHVEQETASEKHQALTLALAKLDSPIKSAILQAHFGLGHFGTRTTAELAGMLKKTNAEIIALRKQAMKELAAILEEDGFH